MASKLADVQRLKKFNDLSIIGRYAERFGKDPDQVFNESITSTVLAFTEMWKESEEFHDRFKPAFNKLLPKDK